MAKQKMCNIPSDVEEKLATNGYADKSGIGVHYMDAYIKPMNTELEDGVKCVAKRRGNKITVTVGDKTGFGLMRRVDVSADPVVMLQACLTEAGEAAGITITEENGSIFVDY
jgi:hypothetical protein